MPALPAYAEAEVIACGLALEARGPVNRLTLHQALGGRGERDRPIAIWLAFVAHRDRFLPSGVTAAERSFSPIVATHLVEAAKAMMEAIRIAEAERDTVHDLRAGMMQHAADAVLARNNALLNEVEAQNAEIAALRRHLGDRRSPVFPRWVAQFRSNSGWARPLWLSCAGGGHHGLWHRVLGAIGPGLSIEPWDGRVFFAVVDVPGADDAGPFYEPEFASERRAAPGPPS